MSKTSLNNLDNFIAKVTTTDLARNNKFEVLITPPRALESQLDNSKLVTLYCESSSLPQQTILTKFPRISGPGYPRPITSDFGGGGLPMSFYIDQQMDVKGFFDAWMFSIVNPRSFFVSYQENYISQIEVRQLDNQFNVVYSIILQDAFPQSVNLLDLNMANQNQTHKLLVNFAFRKWIPKHATSEKYFTQSFAIPQATQTNSNQRPTVSNNTLTGPDRRNGRGFNTNRG